MNFRADFQKYKGNFILYNEPFSIINVDNVKEDLLSPVSMNILLLLYTITQMQNS